MGKKYKTCLFLLAMMGFFLFLSSPISAKEEFRAKLLNKAGMLSDRMINLKMTVENYTTAEEIRDLLKVLGDKGTEGFLRAFHDMKKGVVNVKSARGFNMRINAAQSIPIENGTKIQLFMESQSWDSETWIRLEKNYLFMMIELELDNEGKGTGKFYKGANIQLSGQGTIILESYHPPMLLNAVRKTK